jgi:hypothetical protein
MFLSNFVFIILYLMKNLLQLLQVPQPPRIVIDTCRKKPAGRMVCASEKYKDEQTNDDELNQIHIEE